jgi:hypothetical protein
MPKLTATFATTALSILCLQGCLYTGHHFNTGQLLKSGETHWEMGLGHQRVAERNCSDVTTQQVFLELKKNDPGPHVEGNVWQDRGYAILEKGPNGETDCNVDWYAGYDTVTRKSVVFSDRFPAELQFLNMPSASFGWRLGVRDSWGPMTGVDLGWRLEAVTGPATLEFDARFGLPKPPTRTELRHNVALGWGLGMWADNSLYAEYALGWGDGNWRPFSNMRITYLASQPVDLGDSIDERYFASARRWVGQLFLGCEWFLPKAMLLPGRLMPTVSVAWPSVPFFVDGHGASSSGLEWRFALGMGSRL